MEINFKKIKQYREELNQLLQERPEYLPYQRMIERELEKAGNNPHNRCAVLENMLLENKKKLIRLMEELSMEAKKIVRKLNEK